MVGRDICSFAALSSPRPYAQKFDHSRCTVSRVIAEVAMLPQFRKSETDGAKPGSPMLGQPQASSLGARPAVAPMRAAAHGMSSVIGPDLVIQGNLVSKGEIHVEGEVQG